MVLLVFFAALLYIVGYLTPVLGGEIVRGIQTVLAVLAVVLLILWIAHMVRLPWWLNGPAG